MDYESVLLEYDDYALRKHFPANINQRIYDYAHHEVIRNRYVFVTNNKLHVQWQHFGLGYCTHCGSQFELKMPVSHNESITCPECSSDCLVKHARYKRTNLIEKAYFIWYEKSQLNSQYLIARGFMVYYDLRENYMEEDIELKEVSRYLFRMGQKVIKFERSYHPDYDDWWGRAKSLNSYYIGATNIEKYCAWDNIREAVRGTAFEYSQWQQYYPVRARNDMVEYFDLYARYPVVEHLYKLGFKDLVEIKLHGYRTYGVINWKGKSIYKVLKLNKGELKALRALSKPITTWFLWLYNMFRSEKAKWTVEEIYRVSNNLSEFYYRDLQEVLRYTSLRKAYKYFCKQHESYPDVYHSVEAVLTLYKDYLKDCLELDLNMTDPRVLYPKNLHEAHQNKLVMIESIANEKLNGKIAKRLEDLRKKYTFETDGLLIRSAESSDEIVAEGKVLSHCVGRYCQSYADGKTDILFVRKSEEPDTPFFTVEITFGRVVQVRGKANCAPDDRVRAFMDRFREVKLVQEKVA